MVTELDKIQNYYRKQAGILGDYALISKTDLANGYCDADEAGDEILRSAYFSALMLRYWFKIFKWKVNSKSLHLQDEDFVSWLQDSLMIAFKYRAWRDPNKAVYGDPNGPDKVINQCCESTRGREYQYHNKHKRKANVQTLSIDAQREDVGDCALDSLGAYTEDNTCSGADQLIQYYINKDKGIEALILDAIAKQDVFKETKTKHKDTINDVDEFDEDEEDDINSNVEAAVVDKEIEKETSFDPADAEEDEEEKEVYYTYATSFDPRKLVKHLTSINLKFMQSYFEKTYEVTSEQCQNIFDKLKSLTNTKLYNYIKKTFIEIQNNPELIAYLTK